MSGFGDDDEISNDADMKDMDGNHQDDYREDKLTRAIKKLENDLSNINNTSETVLIPKHIYNDIL